jgi:glycosyltransferase involved in cell wall biosynthesis
MKVMHVISWLSLGGAEQVAIDLSLGMRERGLGPCIVPLLTPPTALQPISLDMRERLRAGNVRVVEMRGAGGLRIGMLSSVPRLAAFLAREPFDIIHTHGDHADLSVSVATRFLKLRVARTIHNVALWPGRSRLGRFVERGFNQDLVLGVSEEALQAHRDLRSGFGLPVSSHARVITNGVPRVEPAARPADVGARIRLAFFGRAAHQKGLDLLLAAAERLVGIDADYELVIHSDLAGDRSGQAQVARLGTRVKLVPPAVNARALMGAFDVVVMPSRWEGMPLVALESFRTGTPVLAALSPGLREALPAGWPLTVPKEDVAALADMLEAIVTSRIDVKGLRLSAQIHGERFGVDRMVDRYIAAYDDYRSVLTAVNPS